LKKKIEKYNFMKIVALLTSKEESSLKNKNILKIYKKKILARFILNKYFK